MNRSRVTGDLASHGNIFADIANDRVGIGSTIPTQKLDVTGTVIATTFSGSGASLTNLPAANLTGTIAAISGANLTNLNGSNIASGTVPVARIGTGTKNTSTFYRGDGTFQVVNTDLSADTSPELGANLSTNGNFIQFPDSTTGNQNKAVFGGGLDLQIYHDGSHSYIHDGGTGNLKVRSNNFRVSNADESKISATFVPAGAVELYHNHSKKLETTSGGVTVSDNLTLSGGNIYLADTYKLMVGTGDDLQIHHDNSNTLNIINSQNGNLRIQHGGTTKLQVLSSGIDVVGTVTADNQIVLNSGDSTPARIDLYCEVSNAHYTRLQAPAHSTYSGNVTATLPNVTGNLAVLANAADNRVVTATGTHAMTGETNFTFDGSSLAITGSQNVSLNNNILSFDRAGYSYIDQTSNSGSLVFRVSASSTIAYRIDSSAQSIFGASGTHIINYSGSATPNNNNCAALFSSNNIGLVGQYSSFNQPFDHSTATTSGNWWMLGRSTGTTNEWGLNVRSGGANNNLNVWKVVGDSNGFATYQAFYTYNGQERLRIDSSGRVIIGHTAARAVAGHTAGFTLDGDNYNAATLQITSNQGGTSGGFLQISHQRSGSAGGNTILQDGDDFGRIRFTGGDGTNIDSRGAEIIAQVDGTPGVDDMPGRLLFMTTADGAQSTTERLRIDKSGAIGIAGANYGTSGQVLTSGGSGSAVSWTTINSDVVSDTSPQLGGDLDTNSFHINLDDDHAVRFGNSNDLQIYHNNSANTNEFTSALSTNFRGKNLYFYTNHNNSSESAIMAYANAQVELYHNNVKKFETSSAGGSLTGVLSVSSNIRVSGEIDLGTANGNKFMDVCLGDNYGFYLRSTSGEGANHEALMTINRNQGATLYWDANTRFKTTTNGIEVTGRADPDADSSHDLGTDNVRWRTAYLDSLSVGGSNNNGTVANFRGGVYNQINIAHANNSGWGLLLTNTDQSTYGSNSGYHFSTNTSVSKPCAVVNVNSDALHFATANTSRFFLTHAGHFLPYNNNAYDIGSTSNKVRNIYVMDMHFSNEGGSPNSVDGTTGNWTLQEGEDGIYMINNKNGKKYEMMLKEVQ